MKKKNEINESETKNGAEFSPTKKLTLMDPNTKILNL